MRFFWSGFLHWSNIYRQNNKAFQFFRICTLIRRLIQIFFTFGGDSVDAESLSLSTESEPSETPCWLSQHRVRLHVNWVSAEWWNLRKCWCLLHILSWRAVSLRVDSVDMEPHSALTQLTGSFTPLWLSVRKMIQTKTSIRTYPALAPLKGYTVNPALLASSFVRQIQPYLLLHIYFIYHFSK